jgi:hypothetical protein
MLFPIDVISEEGVSGCIFEGLGLVWLFSIGVLGEWILRKLLYAFLTCYEYWAVALGCL